jgi:hypothetical protein
VPDPKVQPSLVRRGAWLATGMSVDATPATRALIADPVREFLRNAYPILERMIGAHPDFRPRAWTDELPGLDAASSQR